MLFLFAVVWTTDMLGYFAGRAFGGPKLVPAISPKKTWSGAIAGTLGAMVVARCWSRNVSAIVQLASRLPLRRAGAVDGWRSSAISWNRWIKRRFGAKDASQLIPGHGGVMDRLDGFWAAALVACLIGVAARRLGSSRARPAGMVSA